MTYSLCLSSPLLSSSFPVWTDFWVAIPLAIFFTLIRHLLFDRIATHIVVTRLGLSPTSLRQRQKIEKDPKKRIPTWVLNEIDGFAQDMLLVNQPTPHATQRD